MKVRDILKLEIGDKVKLKDSDAIFEIVEFDENDPCRPVALKLASKPSRRIAYNYLGEEVCWAVTERKLWTYVNKTEMVGNSTYIISKFDQATKDCDVLTIRNLESLDEYDPDFDFDGKDSTNDVAESIEDAFIVGDIVKFKDGNCTLEIAEVDPGDASLKYCVKILQTDKKVVFHPFATYYGVGDTYWIPNTDENGYTSPDHYHITADRLELVYSGPKFAVGDIVEIPGMNAKFEIAEYDTGDRHQPYRIKILATDKPVRYASGGKDNGIGDYVWVSTDRLSPEPTYNYYIPASNYFVKVSGTERSPELQESQELPDICKVREVAKQAIKTKLAEISNAITQASNNGSMNCDVEGLTPAIIERLKAAGYAVDGNTVSW